MPQPIGTSLHTSVPLTNLSIAWQQSQSFVADKVFPIIGVNKQFDQYYKYLKGEWYRTNAQERAPGTESAGTGWHTTTDTYGCRVYAVHKDIDDQARANADNQFNLDRDATNLTTNDILLGRELKWFANFFKTGVWSTQATATTATSNVPTTGFTHFNLSGDPTRDVGVQGLRMKRLTGRKPNTIVTTPEVHLAIVNHPAIIDRVKYTQKGFISTDLLAMAFDVDNYYVADAIQNTATETTSATATANESMDWVAPEGMLLCYVDQNPGLQTVTSGLTFAWNGLFGNAFGTRTSKFRMEHLKSDRIEVESAYDMKLVAPDLGVWFDNPLA